MTERAELIDSFLAAKGWDGAERTALAGDASFRRYLRLTLGDRGAVLMDAPRSEEDVDAFVAVARHLKSLGFSAPDILAKDRDNGLLLLEDLGDETYTRVLDAGGGDGGAVEAGLYKLAVDVLIELHRIDSERVVAPGLKDYDDDMLLEEASLLIDWTWLAVFGAPPGDDIRGQYRDAWLEVFPAIRTGPRTLVLRDYHVDNLMLLGGRDGVSRCGLLDFQDAVRGPRAYDLMSLLEDARRDIDEGLRRAMRERYFAAFPDLDRDAFETAFRVLAAQRHAKVIGIFTRLCVRDSKPDYLVHIPRVWRLLEAALEHPALAPVAAWLEAHMAADKRTIPPCPAAGA